MSLAKKLFVFAQKHRLWLVLSLWLGLLCVFGDLQKILKDAAPGGLVISTLTGAGIAWMLARGRSSGIRAGGLYASVGVGVWVVLTARVLGTIASLYRETYSLLFNFLNQEALQFDRLIAQLGDLNEKGIGLSTRWGQWLVAFAQGRNIEDPVVRGLMWILLFWMLAGWSAWRLGRKNDAIGAFLPLLTVQAWVLEFYNKSDISYLWFSLFIFILTLGFLCYENSLQKWLSKNIDYSENITMNSLLSTTLVAVVVVGTAGLTPSISVDDIRRAWEERRTAAAGEGTSQNGSAAAPASGGTYERIQAGLPRDHLLSGGVELSETPVFQVRTGDFPPIPRSDFQIEVPRYYWRAYTYDIYSGQGWASSPVESVVYPADEIFTIEKPEYYRQVQHSFEVLDAEEPLLFRAGILESASVPLDAEWRNIISRLSLPAAPTGNADLYRATSAAQTYQVNSLIATVDVETLRGVWAEYPEWVRQRYLALPPIPARVTELAQEITATAPSLYDRAVAIETYLRQTYPYDLEVKAPPVGRDPVDYFLFDLKRGYCDYYASAMVVMARASGVPARLVVGYAGGTYDPVSAAYNISQADAHSWVEVYFPGIGWVEFEPTAGLPGFERSGTGAAPLPFTAPEKKDDQLAWFWRWLESAPSALLWVAGITIIIGLAAWLTRMVQDWHDPRPPAVRRVGQIYQSMQTAGAKLLKSDFHPSQTPDEFSSALKTLLSTNAAIDVEQIAGLYKLSVFSKHLPGKQQAKLANQAWNRLRWQLWQRKWKAPKQKS